MQAIQSSSRLKIIPEESFDGSWQMVMDGMLFT
jgi:hypothetical protein